MKCDGLARGGNPRRGPCAKTFDPIVLWKFHDSALITIKGSRKTLSHRGVHNVAAAEPARSSLASVEEMREIAGNRWQLHSDKPARLKKCAVPRQFKRQDEFGLTFEGKEA